MVLFYIVYRNLIWACIASAIAGAAAAGAFFYFKGAKNKSAEDMKPSLKKTVILGLRDNADAFSDLLEPLFLLASGKTDRKDYVLDTWYDRVSAVENNDEFQAAFVKKFGEIASFKGKDKKYVKCADSILKYVYKAGIERDDERVVTADETTAEKYDLIGAGSIEAGAVYDVFVPYWDVENDTAEDTILSKGAIR